MKTEVSIKKRSFVFEKIGDREVAGLVWFGGLSLSLLSLRL